MLFRSLVGLMDINGDGKDDSDQIRELIRLAGGQVDAVMDSKANREANLPGLTPNTSFLVLGTDLIPSANPTPDQMTKLESYERFRAEARQVGVMQISIEKLLGYLRAEGSARLVPLSERIQASDFPIRPEVTPPVSPGSVSEIFKPRTP